MLIWEKDTPEFVHKVAKV